MVNINNVTGTNPIDTPSSLQENTSAIKENTPPTFENSTIVKDKTRINTILNKYKNISRTITGENKSIFLEHHKKFFLNYSQKQ